MDEGTQQYQTTTKYVIRAKFEVQGVVEKPDVIGAIFGQTEGLFGADLDLRELQKSARIGRIEIGLESKHDKTTGTITIPCSLDKASTALIAAALESVDRIGPCEAKVTLEKVEDQREQKRRQITSKAKEILHRWVVEETPSTEEIVREVSQAIRSAEVISYGPEGLTAGPEIESGSIIIVEGRADVLALMKCGVKNAIGLDGTKIPETIIKLCKDREVTAFLDGDRAGDLILKELLQVAELDYVARATAGKEVEELTPKELMRALRERVPVSQGKEKLHPTQGARISIAPEMAGKASSLKGTLEAVLFGTNGAEMESLPVSELAERIQKAEGVGAIIFDGVVTQRLLDIADSKGVGLIVGDRVAEGVKRPSRVRIYTISELS